MAQLLQSVILIVEDDHQILALLGDILADEGYQVLLADTMAAAMSCLRIGRLDLVTLDLNLPDGRGEDLLDIIRTHADTADVPVVIISAKLKIDESIQSRVQAVVAKPFDLDEVLEAVRRLLSPPPAGP